MTTSGLSNEREALDAAIGRLYEAFGRYPRPRGQTYSPYASVTAGDAAAIRERPLRALSGSDLAKYAMRAITTWGDQDEFRYYLPRLLELLVTEDGWTDKATVLQKLANAGWRAWPSREQDAIETFVQAVWAPLLAGQVSLSLADLALGCSLAGISLAPLVDAWRGASAEPASSYQLADLVTLERNELLRDGTFDSRWSPEARRVLDELIRAPETRTRMERDCLRSAVADDARRISDAIEIIEAIRLAT